MYIHCLGLNHQTAEVSLRERVAFDEGKAKAALAGCGPKQDSQSGLGEMVILSTCHRVEFYAVLPDRGPDRLIACLATMSRISPAEFAPHAYHFIDQQAVNHLLRVAAGLDSLVLGEPQILGQVTRALELAHSETSAGPILTRLFQAAIHAGKRARTETHISRKPASIASLVANLVELEVSNLGETQVVVIGAGEMAALTIEALRKRGVNRIVVINRTLGRAAWLAERWNAQVQPLERLEDAIAQADVLITSTGAPQILIHRSSITAIMHERPDRPLIAIDIAVPRDIDPETRSIPGIHLFDIDNLQGQLEESLAERRQAIPKVESILQQEEARFMEYFQTLGILPLIASLQANADVIRQAELKKTLRRMTSLSEADKERIDALTQALVKKLLHAPVHRLRAEATSPKAMIYASIVSDLYGLSMDDLSKFD